jgi:hypothetical protein
LHQIFATIQTGRDREVTRINVKHVGFISTSRDGRYIAFMSGGRDTRSIMVSNRGRRRACGLQRYRGHGKLSANGYSVVARRRARSGILSSVKARRRSLVASGQRRRVREIAASLRTFRAGSQPRWNANRLRCGLQEIRILGHDRPVPEHENSGDPLTTSLPPHISTHAPAPRRGRPGFFRWSAALQRHERPAAHVGSGRTARKLLLEPGQQTSALGSQGRR